MSMIDVKNLFFSYSSDQPLLSGLTFSIKKGEFVALLGANGAGKSTLLKLLLGFLTADSGSITIDGVAAANKKNWTDIGYVPQKLSIDHNHPAKVKELIKDTSMCGHLSIEGFMNKQFKSLSGGQKQRVLVALALQRNPRILFLDEPTVGVDQSTRKKFYDLLRHLTAKHSKTIVLVTHDNELVTEYASKVMCMDDKHHFSEGGCVHD